MRLTFRPFLVAAPLCIAACSSSAEKSQHEARSDTTSAASAAPPTANPDPAANTYAPALGVTLSKFTKQASGVYTRDDKVGAGPVATAGKRVQLHYTGWFTDGQKFDSSHVHGAPLAFTLGRGEVIRGWDEGVAGMKVGGTRTLVVPAGLGYGASSPPGIPPNSVLVFRVELVGVR